MAQKGGTGPGRDGIERGKERDPKKKERERWGDHSEPRVRLGRDCYAVVDAPQEGCGIDGICCGEGCGIDHSSESALRPRLLRCG